MSSRTKLIMEMVDQLQDHSVANVNPIQTSSFDDSFSAGYVELSPVHLMPPNNEEISEEMVPFFSEVEDCNVIICPDEQDNIVNQDLSCSLEDPSLVYTQLSPAKILPTQNNEVLLDGFQNTHNFPFGLKQKEISLYIDGEDITDNFPIVERATNLKPYQIEVDKNNGVNKPTYADSDENYKTESSFDSDDSDLNLQNENREEVRTEENNNDNRIIENIEDIGVQENNKDQALKKKTRKRQRNENQWKRNDKKAKRNTGQAYKTILNQKFVTQRHLKAPCTNVCRFKCFSIFALEERESILKAFWKIGDNTRQRQFISSIIVEVQPKYRYPKDNTKRFYNQSYFLPKNNENVRVCKNFFMSTLNIGDTMIRTTLKKRDKNGIVETEMRGKHGNHKKIDQGLLDGVTSHIESIPRVESHYTRAHTEREYFEGDLNISILYRLYKEQCNQSGKNYVKKCIYEKIFNNQYNIGFFKPKKDQCSTCETYKNSSAGEKLGLEESYQKHIREKELSRIEKAKDIKEATEDKNKKVAVYDLEAVLPTPCGEVSSFYYKSKLATYNLTVFDIVPKQGYCYVWSENCAKRGANEIGSCVLRFLQEFCDAKSITFYSDNCAGKNKNKFVAAMYLFAVSNYNIDSITHKFLITGHTQNEGDSMHSCIEREKKRVLKGGPIYVPAQWIPVIRLAKKTGEPYKVFEIDTSDIFDLKGLSNQKGPNYNVNTKGEKVSWNDIKILNFTKKAPNSIFYKLHYDEPNYSEIDVRGRRSTRNSKCILNNAYQEAPKISKSKKEGLVYLCKVKLLNRYITHSMKIYPVKTNSDY